MGEAINLSPLRCCDIYNLTRFVAAIHHLDAKILVDRGIRVTLIDQPGAINIDQFFPFGNVLATTAADAQTIHVE